jgi:hypothetical protein
MLWVSRSEAESILMTTLDHVTELCYRVDDRMLDAEKHRQANLYPSEVVSLALLFVLNGIRARPLYR